jgi:hypothetical protein
MVVGESFAHKHENALRKKCDGRAERKKGGRENIPGASWEMLLRGANKKYEAVHPCLLLCFGVSKSELRGVKRGRSGAEVSSSCMELLTLEESK